MKQHKYHYVYQIINLINGMKYIGVRSCNCWPTKDNYGSSSSYLKNTILEEGIENFKKEILVIVDNRKYAVELEIYLHNYFDVGKNSYFYNKAKQTSIKYDTTGLKNTEESNRKRSNKQKGLIGIHKNNDRKMVHNNEIDEYLNNGGKLGSNISHSEERKNKHSNRMSGGNNPMWNKKHSVEFKERHSNRMKNTIGVYKNNEKRMINESEIDEYLNNGGNIGSNINREKENNPMGNKKHTNSTLDKIRNKNSNTKGMNDGIKQQKQVKKDKVEEYLNSGGKLGMLK